jgi:hypothetical protein
METKCPCGAVGLVLPPDFTYPRDARKPLMRWRGGRIGVDKVAVEDERRGVSACPACQHRACVFMLDPSREQPLLQLRRQ